MDGYIKPEEKIYEVALDKDRLDWKNFLHQLIYEEGIDPWDIDLARLTKKYIEKIKELREVDFEISGKLLAIAIFLLRTKVEKLLDSDIRGIEAKINELQSEDDTGDSIDAIEELDSQVEEEEDQEAQAPKKKEYKLQHRNPFARKRKVNIFDLINVLEKTLESSRQREKKNILMRKSNKEYDGPNYHEPKKNLKDLMNEIREMIMKEMHDKKAHVTFSELVDFKSKKETVEKLMPILHLSNQNEFKLEQENHFGEIYIKKG